MMYGQVKGPDKGVKVTNTPTSTESSSVIYKGKEKAVNVMPSKPKPVVSPVGRAVKPGSQGEKVKPTGNSKPSGASSAAPERGQRPQSQMDAERPTASPERGQRPQSQMMLRDQLLLLKEDKDLKAKWMLRDQLLLLKEVKLLKAKWMLRDQLLLLKEVKLLKAKWMLRDQLLLLKEVKLSK